MFFISSCMKFYRGLIIALHINMHSLTNVISKEESKPRKNMCVKFKNLQILFSYINLQDTYII